MLVVARRMERCGVFPERGSGERGERGDGLGCASGPLAGRDGYEQASASRYTLLCIYVFILCELKGGSFTETFDILGKGFFRLEELPPLSLERVLPEQIQRMYGYYKHPGEDVYLD